MSHIMDRTQGRPGITVSLILGLILLTPAWTEAGKISNADTADTLREVATASSSPLSNSAIVAILNAGTPVSETTTTTYSDGSTCQTADLLDHSQHDRRRRHNDERHQSGRGRNGEGRGCRDHFREHDHARRHDDLARRLGPNQG